MKKIARPHDKFFKETFSSVEVARDFLKNYLPPEISAHINYDSLKIMKDSFTDAKLNEYFSDLLYKVDFKDNRGGFIYILFEHKSYPDASISFYLLSSMVRIWDLEMKKGSKRLSVIIPLVLYHGGDKWNVGLQFRELLDITLDEFNCYIPDFRYELWDASRYKEEDIKGGVILKVVLLMMKYAMSKDLRGRLPLLLKVMGELSEKETALQYIEVILRYLVHTANKAEIDYKELEVMIKNSLKEKGGEVMKTIADELIERGIERGIRHAVEDVLEVRFGFVPKGIHDTIERLENIPLLETLFKTAVKIGSLEEFSRLLKDAAKGDTRG